MGLTQDWGGKIARLSTDANGNTRLTGPTGKPVPVEHAVISIGVPIGIAPSGSVSAAGALSLDTPLLSTVPGLYLYFPAAAVASGSAAGFYWCEMSTTSAGKVYANTFASGIGEIPQVPTTLVPAAGYASPTAYTGVAVNVSNAVRAILPGGMMGKNGSALVYLNQTNNNSGTAKGLLVKFGVSYIVGSNANITNVHNRSIAQAVNRGRSDKQFITYNASTTAASLGGVEAAIDTAADVIISVDLICGAATDWTMLNHLHVTVLPGE